MRITFFKKDGSSFYELQANRGHSADRIWINNENGEGGDFDADAISDVIFNALDKFFKENH